MELQPESVTTGRLLLMRGAKENTRAGLAAANKRGRRGGRPRAMNEQTIKHAEAMLKDGVVARIGCQVLTQAFATTTDMLNAA